MKSIFALIFYFILGFAYSQPQKVLLLDNFETYPLNSLGRETVFFDTLAYCITSVSKNLKAYGNSGKSLKISYSVQKDKISSCGYVSYLPNTDLSEYRYMSFWVRGSRGGEYFQVELKNKLGHAAKVAIWDYLPCGPSTAWKKVVIPLDAFWNLKTLKDISQLIIVFDNYTSSGNGAPLESDISIDDIVFGSYFLGYVKVDAFADRLNSNSTGGNNGTFSPSGSATNYTSEIVCNIGSSCDCKYRINFDNGRDDRFGGGFFILGGGNTGWKGEPKSISKYSKISFSAFAEKSSTNPGNFKLELKEGDNAYSYFVTGLNTVPKKFNINFGDFTPKIPSTFSATEIAVVFEAGKQDVLKGSATIDDIEFRAANYLEFDTIRPNVPSDIAINANPLRPINSFPLNSKIRISSSISFTSSRLESVRLEYKASCEWKVLNKVFAPFSSSKIYFDFSPSDLEYGATQMEMRIVAENYNGRAAFTSAFFVQIGASISTLELFRNSYEVFNLLRSETGIYTDALRFEGEQFHPGSVATTGMGLIALCIADGMGWINNAEQLVIETLNTVLGARPGFTPDRNSKGWFRHFIDQKSGKRAWNSEYSTIDSGILCAGALFCKSHFKENVIIKNLAEQLYLSIDWNSMIKNSATGEIYLGCCDSFTEENLCCTRPFNEYMLVALLASKDDRKGPRADSLWNRFYSSTSNLPISTYSNLKVLTDFPGNFLSGFVPQFNYFLCNPFSKLTPYSPFFQNALNTDRLWWSDSTDCFDFIYGFGAGAANDWVKSGYSADNLVEHPGQICSPHIIGGFIPINSSSLDDLVNIFNSGLGIYNLPNNSKTPILWRFSTIDPEWRATDIQGVDYSTLLFGIASHPSFLGNDFFIKNNLYLVTDLKEQTEDGLFLNQNFPNPFWDHTTIPFILKERGDFILKVADVFGKVVYEKKLGVLGSGLHQIRVDFANNLIPPGVFYYYLSSKNGYSEAKKMIRMN